MVKEEYTLCGKNRSRVPYGEYTVDKGNFLCCYCVNDINPHCCGICEDDLLNEIATELQVRVGQRGNAGQIQKAEQTMSLLMRMDRKVDRMSEKLDLLLQKSHD